MQSQPQQLVYVDQNKTPTNTQTVQFLQVYDPDGLSNTDAVLFLSQ